MCPPTDRERCMIAGRIVGLNLVLANVAIVMRRIYDTASLETLVEQSAIDRLLGQQSHTHCASEFQRVIEYYSTNRLLQVCHSSCNPLSSVCRPIDNGWTIGGQCPHQLTSVRHKHAPHSCSNSCRTISFLGRHVQHTDWANYLPHTFN